jgi:hypothetical protein
MPEGLGLDRFLEADRATAVRDRCARMLVLGTILPAGQF